jgi:diguanylate cyclase (GGDEF)-like protein/PAS domain S-box-containing protein
MGLRPTARLIGDASLLGASYCAAAILSILLARYGQTVAGLWIANVVAVAIIFRTQAAGSLTSPIGVLAGAVAANLLTGASPTATVLFSTINTAEVWLAVTLISRSEIDQRTIETVPGYLKALAIAAAIAPAVAGCAFAIAASQLLGWSPWTSFASWWAGDALGYAIFFPLLLFSSREALRQSLGDGQFAKAGAAALGCIVFTATAALWTRYPFILIMVPLLVAAAYFRPFCLAIICALAGSTMVAMGLVDLIPDLRLAADRGGFQLSVAIAVALPLLAGLLREDSRRERRRLSESEERFRRAMDDSAIGMALVGLDGRILETNRSLSDMLGYSRAELCQRTFFDITHPEDLHIGRETVRQALAGESHSYRFEKRYMRKDGTAIWALLAGSVIRDRETGKPIHLVSQIENIDARKRADQALKEAESRWNFALDSAAQGVWDFDGRRGRTFHSPLWKRMLGYAPDELSDDPDLWLQLMHPDDRERAVEADRIHKQGETPYCEAEFRMRHKDGRWIWVLDRGSVVERDDQGNVIRAIGTHTDITRQKEAEAHLAATADAVADEKERLRITLHSIADAVICTDSANRVAFMNPAAETLTGFDIVSAYGEPLEAVFCPVDEETGEKIPDPAGREGNEGGEQQGRAVLVRPDGSRRNIREIVSPILNVKNDFAGLVIIFQDISDARALQRNLAYAASHDALTGLANRSGFVRALITSIDEAKTDGVEHALLFIDLDRFKAVNDTAGHLAGDALLKQVATTIKKKVRSNDVVARFGGDEFALLLRHCSPETAWRIGEDLVAAIRDLGFVWEDRPHQIGASIGIAPVTAACGEMDEVVAQADEACYASKAAGRGCVTLFDGRHPQAVVA